MARVYVTEYTRMGTEWAGSVPIAAALEPCNADQTPIETSGTSQQSAAFAGGTRVIRVHTDDVISFAIGDDPTATTNNRRMAAGQTEYFSVTPGHKIAVIDNV